MDENTSVWITEHDDAQIGYVVNELADMEGNYRDLVEAGINQGSLQDYLDTWLQLQMPTTILNGSSAARITWIEAQLGIS